MNHSLPVFFFVKPWSACAPLFQVKYQLTLAQRAEATVDKCSLMNWKSARFPDGFPQLSLKSKRFTVTSCHMHGWQNDWGLLRATGEGGDKYSNKNQHRKLILEKKILASLLPGTFQSRVQHYTRGLSPTGINTQGRQQQRPKSPTITLSWCPLNTRNMVKMAF